MQVLKHNQMVLIDGREFHAFSVRGYAAQYGEGVTQAEQRAVKNGHDLYAFIQAPGVISSDPAYYVRKEFERSQAPRLSFGSLVEFDGRTFRINQAPNRNARLNALAAVLL